jgi:hypothetical protein
LLGHFHVVVLRFFGSRVVDCHGSFN